MNVYSFEKYSEEETIILCDIALVRKLVHEAQRLICNLKLRIIMNVGIRLNLNIYWGSAKVLHRNRCASITFDEKFK